MSKYLTAEQLLAIILYIAARNGVSLDQKMINFGEGQLPNGTCALCLLNNECIERFGTPLSLDHPTCEDLQ